MNVDCIINFLSYFPFSLTSSSILILIYHYLNPSPYLTFNQVITLLPLSLKVLFYFTFVRAISSTLSHFTLNNFRVFADKPKWNNANGDNDIVLITGGVTGIGYEVVKQLRHQGATIVVIDVVQVGKGEGLEGVRYYQCDITDREAIGEIAGWIRKEVGEPTVLINNAGIARGKTILATSPEEFLLTYKVNVLGAHNILNEFLPHLITINHGHIMTTASSASYMSIPQLSEYACSKAAVLALHEVLRGELVHRYDAPNVRTSVICPTKVRTQMGNAMKEQDSQFLSPTLDAVDLATRMVSIINSGYSDHLIAPHFAQALLPLVRVMPDWYKYLIDSAGKTHLTITDEGNKMQHAHYKVVDDLDRKHGLVS